MGVGFGDFRAWESLELESGLGLGLDIKILKIIIPRLNHQSLFLLVAVSADLGQVRCRDVRTRQEVTAQHSSRFLIATLINLRF